MGTRPPYNYMKMLVQIQTTVTFESPEFTDNSVRTSCISVIISELIVSSSPPGDEDDRQSKLTSNGAA